MSPQLQTQIQAAPIFFFCTLLLFPFHLLPYPVHSTGFYFFFFPDFLAIFTLLSSNNKNPYQIFVPFLPMLPCYFHIVIIEHFYLQEISANTSNKQWNKRRVEVIVKSLIILVRFLMNLTTSTGVSPHHGCPIEGRPETHQTITALSYCGVWRDITALPYWRV